MPSTLMMMINVDDPDEPFMDGSDDDFSDLEGELDEDDNDEDMDTDRSTPHSPPASPPAMTPPPSCFPVGTPSTTPPLRTLPAMWTPSLQPVTIRPFQSAVGPTVPVPDSPLEVFELLFTAPLTQMIVDESNR